MVIAAIKLKDICSLEGSIVGDSLLSEPPGKPKSTGVGSLSLLQEIFLTQGLNRGLLHFRQILYQLSYQGSMTKLDSILKSRDITLPTKVHTVNAKLFPVVIYGCESWTIKKAE